jgi:hypothetical protein
MQEYWDFSCNLEAYHFFEKKHLLLTGCREKREGIYTYAKFKRGNEDKVYAPKNLKFEILDLLQNYKLIAVFFLA